MSRKHSSYLWRLLATGFCFLLFAPGAVLAFLVLLPLRMMPFSQGRKEKIARRLIRQLLRLYLAVMIATGPLELTVNGAEKLQTGRRQLIVANHPTLIDAVVLISLIPDVACIVKSELTQSFFMRELIRSTGYLTNSEPKALIEDCRELFGRGRSLLIFPEGTRSTPGQPLKLMRGAAQIALRAQQPITPVVITCSPPALLKGQKWYHVPQSGPVRMIFEVCDDIPLGPYQDEKGGISLASRKLTRYLTDYFHQHLNGPANLHKEK